MQTVKTTSGEIPIPDNWLPYTLNCPIDGTQLAEDIEYTGRTYPCVTCNALYSVRTGKLSQEQLESQARGYLQMTKKRLNEIEQEEKGLLRVLELARQNSFK